MVTNIRDRQLTGIQTVTANWNRTKKASLHCVRPAKGCGQSENKDRDKDTRYSENKEDDKNKESQKRAN